MSHLDTAHAFFARSTFVAFIAGSIAVSACSSPDAALFDGPRGGANPGDTPDVQQTAAALSCTAKPKGRSYTLFDGSNLAADRANENVGINRARMKPFGAFVGEYRRVLGLVPRSLAKAEGSFDEPPPNWYTEAAHSGVSLNALMDVSFDGCLQYTNNSPQYAELPTAQTANEACSSLMRKAWLHSPSPDELSACVTLATTKLSSENDPRRRWAYVCASILSSSQFLTF